MRPQRRDDRADVWDTCLALAYNLRFPVFSYGESDITVVRFFWRMTGNPDISSQRWVSTEKRACIEWSGQLLDCQPLGRCPRTRLASGQTEVEYTELT